MSQRDSYAKAMSGAMKVAERKGTLGVGFGGETPTYAKPGIKKVESAATKAIKSLKK